MFGILCLVLYEVSTVTSVDISVEYRVSVGWHISWYIHQVSGDISIKCQSSVGWLSIKYRWMYQSTIGQQSATIVSAVCASVPSVEYRQCTCISGVSVKHRHCLFNFFTDLFCSAFCTTSHQSYIRYCQQYQSTHVTKRSKLSYRYVIFGDGQTVKSTN